MVDEASRRYQAALAAGAGEGIVPSTCGHERPVCCVVLFTCCCLLCSVSAATTAALPSAAFVGRADMESCKNDHAGRALKPVANPGSLMCSRCIPPKPCRFSSGDGAEVRGAGSGVGIRAVPHGDVPGCHDPLPAGKRWDKPVMLHSAVHNVPNLDVLRTTSREAFYADATFSKAGYVQCPFRWSLQCAKTYMSHGHPAIPSTGLVRLCRA